MPKAYQITITADAEAQLRSLTVREQRILEAAIPKRLQHAPTTPTRAIKRLRPNPLAEFELRVGGLRVLYNIDESEVVLLVVGRKVGNKLVVQGEDFHGHQDDSPQSAGEGPEGDGE